MKKYIERERKFDYPGPTVRTPDLTSLEGVASIGEPAETDLAASYFDTPDLVLARHGITLRRRTGGHDEGWHLKQPAGEDTRTEFQLPLREPDSSVPEELLDKVRVHVRDHPLVVVATLRTTRVERRLYDDAGNPLAAIADDIVRSQRFADGEIGLSTWRELEVELAGGDRALLDSLTERIESAGLRRSGSASKLHRALGLSTATGPAQPAPGPRSTVGHLLSAYLTEQIELLVAQDPLVRTNAPDSVHQMRVATRRLRSVLASYRRMLDNERTEPIRDELKWLGGLLGLARDAEVLLARLNAAVDSEPGELIVGPVRSRMNVALRERHRVALDSALKALDQARYFRLLDDLDSLVEDPPLRRRAERRADRVVPKVVGSACRRVDRAADAAARPRAGQDHDALLHSVRKAAKRARYAAESARPAGGRNAKRLAKRMEALQDALGEHQDTVTARPVLRELGMSAHLAGENVFTFGLLHGLESGLAVAGEAAYESALKAAQQPKVRRWVQD